MRRNDRRTIRSNAGFSIAEIVVGISIAGIVAMMALPASGDLLSRYRLAATANQVAAEVARARMQAIGQNRFVRLRMSSGKIVREVSTNGTSFTADGSGVPVPDGVEMVFGTYDGPTFNRQGLATNTSYALMANSQGYKLLQVNILGRVREL